MSLSKEAERKLDIRLVEWYKLIHEPDTNPDETRGVCIDPMRTIELSAACRIVRGMTETKSYISMGLIIASVTRFQLRAIAEKPWVKYINQQAEEVVVAPKYL